MHLKTLLSFSITMCCVIASFSIVTGLIDPDNLGVTLTHEHILLDFSTALLKPDFGDECLENLDIKMENLGKIRHYP